MRATIACQLRTTMLAVGVAAGAITPQVLADVITGAGIVGYQSFCSRKGMFVVGMSEVNEVSGLRLSSIRPAPEEDGVSLKFYDGYRWNEAIYALCTDNAYHWISKEEGFLCDDEIVPVGAAIAYELPEGVERLCVAGGIGRIEDAINMTTLEMIPKQEMEAKVRRAREMMPKETACIAVVTNTVKEFVIDKTILTNLVVVTNTVVPDRFVIRFSDGHTQRAQWSWQLSKAIDPVSGIPMNLNCGDVAFEEDKDAPPKERASEVQRCRFYDEQFLDGKRERKQNFGEQVTQKSVDWIWGKAFAVLERLIWFLLFYPIGKWLFRRWRGTKKRQPNDSSPRARNKRHAQRKGHHRR